MRNSWKSSEKGLNENSCTYLYVSAVSSARLENTWSTRAVRSATDVQNFQTPPFSALATRFVRVMDFQRVSVWQAPMDLMDT